MPHYEYECSQCGHRFEVFQRMTDAKLEICPECGGKVERLIGPGAGIVFKGSGFYQTDYRSDSYKKAAKSEGGGSKSESSTPPAEKKTDQTGSSPAQPAQPAKPAPEAAKPATSGGPEPGSAPKRPKPGAKP